MGSGSGVWGGDLNWFGGAQWASGCLRVLGDSSKASS